MINNVLIENFRGFKSIGMGSLSPITLISGKNNVGKSTILEAIFFLYDHLSADSFGKMNIFRGELPVINSVDGWEPLFYDLNPENTMHIEIHDEMGRKEFFCSKDYNYDISSVNNYSEDLVDSYRAYAKEHYSLNYDYIEKDYNEHGYYYVGQAGVMRSIKSRNFENEIKNKLMVQYINNLFMKTGIDIANLFGKLEISGDKGFLIKILKNIESELQDIFTVSVNGQPQLFFRSKTHVMPIKYAGDGINKLMYILLSIISSKNKLILIDEIETGFHYSMYPVLWECIIRAALNNDCQIIATTHSYENIAAAVESVRTLAKESEFVFFRIDKQNDIGKSYRYTSDMLYSALKSEVEVR